MIAKEVATWLWAVVKKTATAKTTTAKVRAIFTKTNLLIIADLLSLWIYLGVISEYGWTDEPISGKHMFLVLGMSFLTVVVVIALLIHIGKAMEEHARRKALAAMHGPPKPPMI